MALADTTHVKRWAVRRKDTGEFRTDPSTRCGDWGPIEKAKLYRTPNGATNGKNPPRYRRPWPKDSALEVVEYAVGLLEMGP